MLINSKIPKEARLRLKFLEKAFQRSSGFLREEIGKQIDQLKKGIDKKLTHIDKETNDPYFSLTTVNMSPDQEKYFQEIVNKFNEHLSKQIDESFDDCCQLRPKPFKKSDEFDFSDLRKQLDELIKKAEESREKEEVWQGLEQQLRNLFQICRATKRVDDFDNILASFLERQMEKFLDMWNEKPHNNKES